MDWDKLKIFHAVAEAGSFTNATINLNLSQSAISRQIQSLEQDLKVVKICKKTKGKNKFSLLYNNNVKLWDKIELIAKKIYRANKITASDEVKEQLKTFEDYGHGGLPVCIAKTQYSFSTDPKLKGAPSNHEIPIREVRLSSGAEFIVVICGSIMTMPGLPKIPAANSIKLNKKGETEGLF